ncbi:MAG TPA: four helix bundle protein [Candidatus Omnitrophica bacterium]|nr:four helix bundle protein [Candidatus Omnitrophota bacterium]
MYTIFLNIALRSAFEVDSWINLIKDGKILNISSNSMLDAIKAENEQIIKMLIKLIHSQIHLKLNTQNLPLKT